MAAPQAAAPAAESLPRRRAGRRHDVPMPARAWPDAPPTAVDAYLAGSGTPFPNPRLAGRAPHGGGGAGDGLSRGDVNCNMQTTAPRPMLSICLSADGASERHPARAHRCSHLPIISWRRASPPEAAPPPAYRRALEHRRTPNSGPCLPPAFPPAPVVLDPLAGENPFLSSQARLLGRRPCARQARLPRYCSCTGQAPTYSMPFPLSKGNDPVCVLLLPSFPRAVPSSARISEPAGLPVPPPASPDPRTYDNYRVWHNYKKIVVECKHRAKLIGRPVVQKLHSAFIAEKAAAGMVISTSGFSAEAEEYEFSEPQTADVLGAIGRVWGRIILVDLAELQKLADAAGIRMREAEDPSTRDIDAGRHWARLKTSRTARQAFAV